MDLISKKSAVSKISDLLILELKSQRIPTWNEVYNAIGDIPSAPAVPLDKLCVLLKELNESGYSFQCAFCKKAFPAWCEEKNKDIGWDRELHCPTWEEITEWIVKLDAN